VRCGDEVPEGGEIPFGEDSVPRAIGRRFVDIIPDEGDDGDNANYRKGGYRFITNNP
jgi:hypothetical protein